MDIESVFDLTRHPITRMDSRSGAALVDHYRLSGLSTRITTQQSARSSTEILLLGIRSAFAIVAIGAYLGEQQDMQGGACAHSNDFS